MKVKIQQRTVYHKFAEVEIEINKDEFENGKYNLYELILKKEEAWSDNLEHELNKSDFIFGNGLDYLNGMNQIDSEGEWRYECEEIDENGHL